MTDQSGGYASGGTGSAYESQSGGGSSQISSEQSGSQNLVIPLQQEQMRVATQQINAGGVRIQKKVTTETVSQPVHVRRETVTVDRLPSGSSAQGISDQGAAPQFSGSQAGGSSGQTNAQGGSLNTPFQEGEVTINLTKEQPVVQTTIVPAGSVVVRKQVTTEPMNVQGQVRRETVQAVPIGNPQNVNISSNLQGSAQSEGSSAGSAGANEASGAAPSDLGQSSGTGSSGQITQLSQLTGASDQTTLAGQSVNISDAKVQQVAGDRLITIAAPDGSSVYVRVAQPATGLTPGQKVSLNGTVRQVPQSTSSLGLDERSGQMLQGQKVFIDANSVKPSNQ